ncbi:MAG: AAA family ATPase, partial [Chloroflexi bacterium]|nr:AAA family ATPase [Chloroflexota bacterium]
MPPARASRKKTNRASAPDAFEVASPDLRWRCDPKRLKFSCTDEIKPPTSFVGQERAAAALEVGLGVARPGFNIFVTGQTGTGRAPVVMAHLRESIEQRKKAGKRGRTADWCYVFNFEKPDQPNALRLDGGEGSVFAGRVAEILETLIRDLRNAFQDETYQAESKRLVEEANGKRQEIMSQTERFAFERGFAIQMSPVGVSVVPLTDGKPMEQSQFLTLSAEKREDLDRRRQEVADRVEQTMAKVHSIEHDRQRAARELAQRVAENTIRFPFEAIASHYKNNEAVNAFLEGLREYTLNNIPVFLQEKGEPEEPVPPQAPRLVQDPTLPFRVNVFVSNPDANGAPIVEETNPTYTNMFGHIERRPYLGTYVTDHTMLRPGAIVRASGGYLVVYARDTLRQPGVWEALKRALRGGQVRPEDPSEAVMPGLVPQSLRPEPIPIDTKVI